MSSKTHPIKRTKSALVRNHNAYTSFVSMLICTLSLSSLLLLLLFSQFRAHFARTELSKPTRPLYRSASQYMIPSERRLTFIEKKSNNNDNNDNYRLGHIVCMCVI